MQDMQPPVALGIDVGGTNTKVGLVDVAGHVYAFERIPTNVGADPPDPFLARLQDVISGAREGRDESAVAVMRRIGAWVDSSWPRSR